MSDWAADPDVQRYFEHFRANVLPQIEGSALFMALMPNKPDIKMATELGMAILLGKPLIVVVPTGRDVPESLERLASAVVRGELDDPDTLADLRNALVRYGGE